MAQMAIILCLQMIEYRTVARMDELKPGCMKLITDGPQPVVLAHTESSYYAFEANCPHEFAPLHQGSLAGPVIECQRHRYTFHLCSGENLHPKSTYPPRLEANVPHLRTFPVRILEREIQIGFEQS